MHSFSTGLLRRHMEYDCISPKPRVSGWLKHLVDPRRLVHKYFLLCLICLFIPGPYFLDALVGAYKGELVAAMDLTNEQYGLLFALSAITGIANLFSGSAISCLGRTRFAMLSSLFVFLGAILTVMSFHYQQYEAMLLGRVIFWLALYALMMVQTIFVYAIFADRALVTAYGLTILCLRGSACLGYFASGPMVKQFGTEVSLWLGVGFVGVAFVATLLFAMFFRGTATAQAVRPLLGDSSRPSNFLAIGSVRRISVCNWAFMVALGCIYMVVFPFEAIAVDMLHSDYGYTDADAGYMLSIIPGISLFAPVLAPVLGRTVRRRYLICFLSFVMAIVAMAVLYIQAPWSPPIGFVLMGSLFVLMVCCSWSSIPMLVEASVPPDHAKEVETMMVGISYFFVALLQCASNVMVGTLKDASPTYQSVCIWFILCSATGMFCMLFCLVSHGRVAGRPRGSKVNVISTPIDGTDEAPIVCKHFDPDDCGSPMADLREHHMTFGG